jgi:hypothetical protein
VSLHGHTDASGVQLSANVSTNSSIATCSNTARLDDDHFVFVAKHGHLLTSKVCAQLAAHNVDSLFVFDCQHHHLKQNSRSSTPNSLVIQIKKVDLKLAVAKHPMSHHFQAGHPETKSHPDDSLTFAIAASKSLQHRLSIQKAQPIQPMGAHSQVAVAKSGQV